MSLRKRRLVVGGIAAAMLLAAYAAPAHHSNIRILAAEKGDTNPARIEAAIDIGMLAFSVLITWTRRFAD